MTKAMVKNIVFMRNEVVLNIKCVRPETALEIAKDVLNTKENFRIMGSNLDGYYVSCNRQEGGELRFKKYRDYDILIDGR